MRFLAVQGIARSGLWSSAPFITADASPTDVGCVLSATSSMQPFYISNLHNAQLGMGINLTEELFFATDRSFVSPSLPQQISLGPFLLDLRLTAQIAHDERRFHRRLRLHPASARPQFT
jgi:hypothetical protein